MKRFRSFLFAVVVVGMVGCSSGHHTADPVGTWTLDLDVDCNGTDGTKVWHFYSDGTVGNAGDPANWTVDGDQITVTFSYGGIWNATVVDDNALSGTYTNPGGGAGCWSGTKTSETP